MTLRTIPCTCTMRPDSWVISGVTAGNGSIIFRWRIVRCHVWLQGKYCTVWIHQKTMNTRFQALNFHPHSCHSSFMIFMFLTVLTFCRLLFLSWPWYMLWVVFFICPYLYHLQRYHSWCLDLICLSVQYRIPLVWMLYELLLSTACWNLCGWSLSLSTSVAMVDHAERFHIYIYNILSHMITGACKPLFPLLKQEVIFDQPLENQEHDEPEREPGTMKSDWAQGRGSSTIVTEIWSVAQLRVPMHQCIVSVD